MSSTAVPKVIPAQLSFLAIYNPSLGTSDETFDQQIVFYYSKAAKTRAKLRNGDAQQEQDLRDQENEKLRQVGLAQGMVGFAKSFSNGEAVDTVETEKSRIVLHELENGWWILASIDLTQLPAASGLTRKDSSTDTTEPVIEYSSREVSPPALLIQQLVRAQLIFLLHHGLTLEGMFAKHGRTKFCSILDKYWSRFASNWDVLLHGSPAVDIFGGMKLAAGGELGMGVGEEEWGSSERDVLEDFARRTPGLVDVMVSRFGEVSPLQQAKTSTDPRTLDDSELDPWVGVGRTAQAADGVVFSGLGAVSRKSLRDLSHWVESIYCYGEYAYGVRDNPASDRKKRRRRNPRTALESEEPTPDSLRPTRPERPRLATSNPNSALPLGIPPPIVRAAESSLDKAAAAVDSKKPEQNSPAPESKSMLASLGDTETWTKYMTLGYGTAWGGKKATDSPQPSTPVPEPAPAPEPAPVRKRSPSPEAMRYVEPAPDVDHVEERAKQQIRLENNGYFLVGLKGDLQDLDVDDENDEGNWNNRIPLRTIHVEVDRRDVSSSSPDVESDETPPYERIMNIPPPTSSKLSRLRPVVYIHRPFIYVFLFEHRTHSLGVASFYRDIHNFFSPLHRSLDKSTSPTNVAQRLQAVSSHYTTEASTGGSGPSAGPNTQPIYDLVFDPRTLTVHSSLPDIPDPGTLLAEGLAGKQAGWSRLDALNVHSQMLATVASTRRNLSEIERTCKTNRGWWVVWMRLPPSHVEPQESDLNYREYREQQHQQQSDEEGEGTEPEHGSRTSTPIEATSAPFNTQDLREAFLVRRARDSDPGTQHGHKSTGSRFGSGVWSGLGMGGGNGSAQSQRMGGAAAGWGPKGLAEGIGIDARRYVEDLLSLNR
ncbi:hypothetical protein COCCADRAFT_8838 [Bipolaris zeicola 26-R-13]|uniref:CCZ1/INTU/HSP4 first Longin domain-containing protein n=1 Tax=Cochliobolus carbonum (strain 26-R-13) TaxID=930089 RepID=W6XTA4_COCC2|nr:uncharacterized protein COCCADRAFT_8838 [Bipolaris zeicola 26-R-13]EUC28863.1 hypothetical protein COCCADRAFT_8838 [Bipolaris zeicola 26-R-13]